MHSRNQLASPVILRRAERENIYTSKTPLGREATVGCGLLGPGRLRHRVTTCKKTLWNAPGRGITALTHLGASLDDMDEKQKKKHTLSPPDHDHTPLIKKAFPKSVPPGRPAGHHLHTFIVNGNMRLRQYVVYVFRNRRTFPFFANYVLIHFCKQCSGKQLGLIENKSYSY